jgi:adenylate cyclase
VLRPDLILLDIMMPKLDGVDVTRRLKGDASLPFIPIILLTAKSDAKDIVAGLEAGGDDYLTKPFDHASLLARVPQTSYPATSGLTPVKLPPDRAMLLIRP